jgi:hypothetical protein
LRVVADSCTPGWPFNVVLVRVAMERLLAGDVSRETLRWCEACGFRAATSLALA